MVLVLEVVVEDLINKFFTSHGTELVIAIVTKARDCAISWTWRIHHM